MPASVEGVLAEGHHRAELTAYCRRMLGSSVDAEDAVQETLLRAWRASRRFEGRAPVRSWLYRIATNVCLDALGHTARRPIPVEEVPPPKDPCREPDDPSDRALAQGQGGEEHGACNVDPPEQADPPRRLLEAAFPPEDRMGVEQRSRPP